MVRPLVGADAALGLRIAAARAALYDDGGTAVLALYLGITHDAYLAHEAGVPMPPEVLARFADLVGADPEWLAFGDGR